MLLDICQILKSKISTNIPLEYEPEQLKAVCKSSLPRTNTLRLVQKAVKT